jgi:iron-sulfur cluster assembly protein
VDSAGDDAAPADRVHEMLSGRPVTRTGGPPAGCTHTASERPTPKDIDPMLTLTATAATTIRELVQRSEVPEGGLRIADDPTGASLTISLAAVPAEDDQVLDAAGAKLFLDPKAAQVLDDKTLDAGADAEGRVQFGVAQQP